MVVCFKSLKNNQVGDFFFFVKKSRKKKDFFFFFFFADGTSYLRETITFLLGFVLLLQSFEIFLKSSSILLLLG